MTTAVALTHSAPPLAPMPAGGSALASVDDTRPKMEKASLELHEPKPTSGGAELGPKAGSIPF